MSYQFTVTLDKWIIGRVSVNDTYSIYRAAHQFVDILTNEHNGKNRLMDEIWVSTNNRDIHVTFIDEPTQSDYVIFGRNHYNSNTEQVGMFFRKYNTKKKYQIQFYVDNMEHSNTDMTFKFFDMSGIDILEHDVSRNIENKLLHIALDNVGLVYTSVVHSC